MNRLPKWIPSARLHQDQSGSAYALGVVLILPLLTIFLLVIIEITLLFHSYHGLTAALQTASRNTSAWWMFRDDLQRHNRPLEQLVQQSTCRNMLPYTASNLTAHRQADSQLESTLLQLGWDPRPAERFAKKYDFLKPRTRVSITPSASLQREGMTVEVEYDSPLWCAFLAPLLATGADESGPYRTIGVATWVSIADVEAQRDALGIHYSPHRVTSW